MSFVIFPVFVKKGTGERRTILIDFTSGEETSSSAASLFWTSNAAHQKSFLGWSSRHRSVIERTGHLWKIEQGTEISMLVGHTN